MKRAASRRLELIVFLAIGSAAHAQSPSMPSWLEVKPGDDFTLRVPSGELTLYGNLDVSVDVATKGMDSLTFPLDGKGLGPVGNMGWLPDLSTNLSYVGVRGFETLGESGLKFVYQLETQLDIAATSGSANTNSQSSDIVKGALTSRNSFIGLGGGWGTLRVGKTDAPYRLTTARLNPFSAMNGDYQVIMANTGGDNRVEFGTRVDHAIWYESPKVYGLSLAVLFAPGQNRGDDSGNLASGSSDCTGGNIPGSGGTGGPASGFPIACNDGAFSDAFSASLSYEGGPLYLAAAYERHQKVNRNSDVYAIYGAYPLPAEVAGYDTADVAAEDATKIAAQVKLPTGTSVGGIVEYMHRYVPSYLEFQNERQRWGTWVTVSQDLTDSDSIHLGWAHAGKTPGDPGQHNSSNATVAAGGAAGGANVDNTANMYTVALKHRLTKNLVAYLDWAMTANGPYAHYDLGAGGRAVTTDCHDASLPASGDVNGNPHCWTGAQLMAVSIGLKQKF